MNGFEQELRTRLLALTAHASVQGEAGLQNWPTLVAELQAGPAITGAAPYIEQEAMLSGPGGLAGALITGIEPDLEQTVSRVGVSMLVGSLADLESASYRIVLGRVLAQRLGIAVGQTVAVLVPRLAGAQGGGSGARLVSFTVVGIFELGVQDHDSNRAFINLADAADLAELGNRITGIRVETTDIFAAPRVVRERVAQLSQPDGLVVWDWTQQNASYFRAIRIEKTMMALLLSLIIGVAAFNIVATLVMVVTEKRSGIAILRTLGCTRADVITVFVLQGTLIGWLGAIVGIVLGILISLNIDTLAPAIENALGFQFMPADLYYLTALPVELQPGDVIWSSLAVLVLTSLATVYPALRAASVQPAEVLRYE
jgi:lipoprotein-releasing system permease protein